RVTRNSDLWLDEEEVKNLRQALQGELPQRHFGSAVRLEVLADCPEHLAQFLLRQFDLESMDLYRVDGPVNLVRLQQIYGLLDGARRGKEVTVVVELMARFDEEANINWAERLEEVGAQVVYGVVGLKTHAKMALVIRREDGSLRYYAHLGTGNYHPTTSKLY